MTINHLLYLFIASLPACYWTITPTLCCMVVFLALYAESKLVTYSNGKAASEFELEFKKMRQEVDALNAKAGFTGRI